MKTTDLTGALLEYWVARAEGDKPEDLTIKRNQVFRQHHDPKRHGGFARVLDYSTNWALTGPLLEKHGMETRIEHYGWEAWAPDERGAIHIMREATGEKLLIAICRAVVRAAFGDEVEDIQ
ncbi:MAG: phage protein NinX family protein [Pseudomonadota bacterium]